MRHLSEVGDILLSPDIFDECFLCDIIKCKGACCVDGDSGAPLCEDDILAIEDNYQNIKQYMQPSGIEAVETQGVSVIDADGELVTPLISGRECAYSYFDDNGVCLCAIEKAYNEHKCSFRKPLSCWLYPIRVLKLPNNTIALNYHKWECCSEACKVGKKIGLPVYKFLKEPLTAAFGADFYEALEREAKVDENTANEIVK